VFGSKLLPFLTDPVISKTLQEASCVAETADVAKWSHSVSYCFEIYNIINLLLTAILYYFPGYFCNHELEKVGDDSIRLDFNAALFALRKIFTSIIYDHYDIP
jgi:hypothetical protein